MITRKEYLAALTVVEAFHKQVEEIIAVARSRPKVPVREFIQKVEISIRVRSTLSRLMELQGKDIFLEEINEFDFCKMRNTGRLSWQEFSEKREKYLQECWLRKSIKPANYG